MKRLPVLIVAVMLAMMAVVAGCGRTPRYDGRLVAADSLMRSAPDSALAIVEDICRDSLVAEGDRAYRDLLLTQARYRCYVTATSDSDINRALTYYRSHPKEREKLTRACIYKGAVMEELGHPDSAMFYYKHAEATAAPDDYFNLGYVKLQMGALYNSYYSMDGKESQKYEEALECFRLGKDSVYILVCLNNLGCLLRESKPEKAEFLLKEASRLAKQLCDTARIIYSSWALIELDYNQNRFVEAYQLIRETISYGIDDFDYSFFFTISNVYSRLGILDTAEVYFDQATKNYKANDAVYEMRRLGSLSELALLKGDSLSYLIYGRESEKIADSLKSNRQKLEIFDAEISFDKESKKLHQNDYDNIISSYRWLIVLSVAVLLFLLYHYYRKGHRYDRLINELKMESQNHISDINTLKQNIDQLKIRDNQLKDFITSHMGMMREMIDECYRGANVKQIKHTIEEIVRFQKGNNSQWLKLFSYIDAEYGDIMSITRHNYPLLSDKELLLLALTTLNCSCIQIATILGYSNISSVGPIRQRLAKKMQLDGSLNQYIQQFKPI